VRHGVLTCPPFILPILSILFQREQLRQGQCRGARDGWRQFRCGNRALRYSNISRGLRLL